MLVLANPGAMLEIAIRAVVSVNVVTGVRQEIAIRVAGLAQVAKEVRRAPALPTEHPPSSDSRSGLALSLAAMHAAGLEFCGELWAM